MERVKKSKIKLLYKDVLNNFFYLKTSGKLSSNDIKKASFTSGCYDKLKWGDRKPLIIMKINH